MSELNLAALVDELAPVLTRYQHLGRFLLSDQIEPDQVGLFLDDNNQRFTAILDRLAGVTHEA